MTLVNVGSNSSAWRGGHSEYRGTSWRNARRAIRARDKVCVDCGKDGRLDVHHIVPFETFGVARHEEANRLANLVLLCKTCHQLREWTTGRVGQRQLA